jgi:hypothetical protein
VLLSSNDGIDAAIKGQEVVPLSDSLEDWAAQIDARTEDANVLEQTFVLSLFEEFTNLNPFASSDTTRT